MTDDEIVFKIIDGEFETKADVIEFLLNSNKRGLLKFLTQYRKKCYYNTIDAARLSDPEALVVWVDRHTEVDLVIKNRFRIIHELDNDENDY